MTKRLFESPLSSAAGFRGKGTCSILSRDSKNCFDIDYVELVLTCPECLTKVLVHGSGPGVELVCQKCGRTIPTPGIKPGSLVSLEAAISGLVLFPKDTEFGWIDGSKLESGLIVKLLPRFLVPDIQTIPPAERYTLVEKTIPGSTLADLLAVPRFTSWQEKRWLFHCLEPMVYVGFLGSEDFNNQAPDGEGKNLFQDVIEEGELLEGGPPDPWAAMECGAAMVHLFRCQSCGKQRLDMDFT